MDLVDNQELEAEDPLHHYQGSAQGHEVTSGGSCNRIPHDQGSAQGHEVASEGSCNRIPHDQGSAQGHEVASEGACNRIPDDQGSAQGHEVASQSHAEQSAVDDQEMVLSCASVMLSLSSCKV